MGLENRNYYQDSYSTPWDRSQVGGGGRSIVVTLIIINVVIFFLDNFIFTSPYVPEGAPESFKSTSNWLGHLMALKPAEILAAPWQIWQFLSYGFAHASVNSEESFFHVGGNMLILFFLGRPVEQRLGRDEFLKFYIIAILISGLGFFLYQVLAYFGFGTLMKNTVGASGAVSAVVALFIFYYPQSTLLLFGIVPVKAWILGVIVVGMDLLRSFNPDSAVAWQAHLAGFAFGYAYFRSGMRFDGLKLGWIKGFFAGQPKLKIHRPTNQEKIRQEGDRILQKINEQGEESLTSRERKILKQYSEQLRNDRS